MSEENKTVELKDEELKKVAGGHNTTLHKTCPFCGVTFHIDGMARYSNGEYITSCANGHQVYYASCGYDVKNDKGEVIRVY